MLSIYGMQRVTAWAWAILALCAVCFSEAASGTTTDARPVITGFSPASGTAGTLVIINGQDLFDVVSITFSEGISAPIYGNTGDGTGVQTEVPAGAVSGPIQVRTASGTATSPEAFEIVSVPPPVIESFTPPSGRARTMVTLRGSGLTGVQSVTFNGTPAFFGLPSGGELSAEVPEGATTGPITVTTANGSFTTAEPFTVIQRGPPVIESFSPKSGPPYTMVTIRGTDLMGAKSVLLNGVPVEVGGMVGTLVFSVPLQATSGPITVVTDLGSATTTEPFEVTPLPPPSILGFVPTQAQPGATVVFDVSNIRIVKGVKFSGVNSPSFTWIGNQVIAMVPYAPSGPVTILAETGPVVSSEPFTVIGGPPAAVLLGFSPLQGLPGSMVTIQATNYGTIESVQFNGIEAAFRDTGGGIEAVVPPFATSGPITLQTRFGPVTSAQPIQIYNSGELDLFAKASRDPVVLGDRVTFTVTITNTATATISEVALTNTFACGDPVGALSWNADTPFLPSVASLEDLEILRVTSSQGTVMVTDGIAVVHLGDLEPGRSAVIQIEVEPHLPDVVCLLSTANNLEGDRLPVYSGFVATTLVLGAVQLQVRQVGPGEIEISWPATEPPLVLQSADQPLRNANWTDVDKPVTVTERSSVRVPVSDAVRFFRLVERASF